MQRLTLICLVITCVTRGAYGRPLDIDVMSIVPSTPTPTDDITLEVEGTFDMLAHLIQRAPWHRMGKNIYVDLLVIELPIRTQSIPGPFEQAVDLGLLTVGTYDVTVRAFVEIGWDSDSFPKPWLFPDVYNGARPVDTLDYRFEVIPEPSTFALTALGLLGIGYLRRNKQV
jgi:hypothetical protein